jgi:UDP-N-acetylglucosamine diphosphorylase/glucosamine-1-phosphate N-acetyltransferase
MKCVILAAGEGKRMHPLTYSRPKVMLPIANQPILEWNMRNALKAGITEFLFVIGYKSEMVRDYFKDGKKWDAHITYVNQRKALGTGHAIGMVEPFVDECLVLCGDTVFGFKEIQRVVDAEPPSIGVVQVEHPEEYGIIETKHNKLVKIYEKMANPFSNLINAGIYHFTNEIFDYIKRTEKSPRGEYEITDSINMMVQKQNMTTIELKEWRDIVYPWHLLDANCELLENTNGTIKGIVEDRVTVKGEVTVGNDTVIKNGVYIEGPVMIGDHCIIGPNCYLRPNTCIGHHCHIGHAVELKNSIIMDETNIPHHNYVGDSVIGQDCNLGSGTKVANLRLDKKTIKTVLNGNIIDTKRRKLGTIMGDHVQTGINAMLNVGSIIGNNVFIGPGAIVNGEICPHAEIQ